MPDISHKDTKTTKVQRKGPEDKSGCIKIMPGFRDRTAGVRLSNFSRLHLPAFVIISIIPA